MEFSKLKEIARRLGGILVMDGDDPEFVIMSYDKFSSLEMPSTPANSSGYSQEDQALIDTLNKEISALKEEIKQKETAELV